MSQESREVDVVSRIDILSEREVDVVSPGFLLLPLPLLSSSPTHRLPLGLPAVLGGFRS